jgi:hypothetical protein
MVYTTKNRFNLFLLLITIFNTSCGSSLQNKHDILSLSQVNEDFKALTTHIEKDVPHPYYTCPKNSYDSLKRIVMKKLHDSMSVFELYRTIYPLVQILNDSHFSILLPKSSNEPDTTLYFPFKVILKNNQLFVFKNLSSNTAIKCGDEIISIDGVFVKSIIEKIRSCNFKSMNEENFFEQTNFFTFPPRLYAVFGFNTNFSVQTEKGTFHLTGVRKEKLLEENKIPDSFYTFKILTEGMSKTGYLKISSLVWNKKEQSSVLDSFLNTSFKKLKENSVPHLIIDIRNDVGGSSVLAKVILDYITNKPYTLSWGEEYFKNGNIVRENDTTLHVPANSQYKFFGETILLTNVLSYSSAHMMAVGFQYYHLGKTVGQISSEPLFITGEVQSFTLPNSKCLFYYPTSNFILPGFEENKKNYFIPDYKVYPDFKDQLNNKDTLLNFAVKLFKDK